MSSASCFSLAATRTASARCVSVRAASCVSTTLAWLQGVRLYSLPQR